MFTLGVLVWLDSAVLSRGLKRARGWTRCGCLGEAERRQMDRLGNAACTLLNIQLGSV
jgi:hypothetical protein